MSVNITLNTTIEVPLQLAATMQADGDAISGFELAPGMYDLRAKMYMAVCSAVKNLPYIIRPRLASAETLPRRPRRRTTVESSTNVAIDTTIQVSLALVAVLEANSEATSDFQHAPGIGEVTHSMTIAVVRAVQALPYRIQLQKEPRSQPLPSPTIDAQQQPEEIASANKTPMLTDDESRPADTPLSQARSLTPEAQIQEHLSAYSPVRPIRRRKFAISVHLVNGEVIQHRVHASTTTLQLKEMIQEKEGIQIEMQRLIYQTRTICSQGAKSEGEKRKKDRITLSKLGITRGAHIYQILPFKGSSF